MNLTGKVNVNVSNTSMALVCFGALLILLVTFKQIDFGNIFLGFLFSLGGIFLSLD